MSQAPGDGHSPARRSPFESERDSEKRTSFSAVPRDKQTSQPFDPPADRLCRRAVLPNEDTQLPVVCNGRPGEAVACRAGTMYHQGRGRTRSAKGQNAIGLCPAKASHRDNTHMTLLDRWMRSTMLAVSRALFACNAWFQSTNACLRNWLRIVCLQ